MNTPIAIDSNVLVALLDGHDKWHSKAKENYAALESKGAGFVYFDCVMNEAISVLARRSEEQKRSEEFPLLLSELQKKVPADKITWILPAIRRIYDDTIELVRKTSGALNFNDSLMALICRELGIRFIACFDHDFDRVEWLKRIAERKHLTSIGF